ncbi:class I glutamine amidotransferase-like protein [Xylariaceae sp. FL0255]|nr:class I glutamine amidotransferase-like protein [Xylariaceae sp. FL0255]
MSKPADPDYNPKVGPKYGTLILAGGGTLPDEIYAEVLHAAALFVNPSSLTPREVNLVLIPTASDAADPTTAASTRRDAAAFTRLGGAELDLKLNITILHTAEREEADTEEFVRPLWRAHAVWFGGGRQWRLVDAYAGTKTEGAVWGVLEGTNLDRSEPRIQDRDQNQPQDSEARRRKGGVIGGTSAGASIQGSILARGDVSGNQIMLSSHAPHRKGFGFLRNVAVDQHVLARNRVFDMFGLLSEVQSQGQNTDNPHTGSQTPSQAPLGLGIDESTALVVHQDGLDVIGGGYGIIYDSGFWSREGGVEEFKKGRLPADPNRWFYFIRKGDRYHLGERKVLEARRDEEESRSLGLEKESREQGERS